MAVNLHFLLKLTELFCREELVRILVNGKILAKLLIYLYMALYEYHLLTSSFFLPLTPAHGAGSVIPGPSKFEDFKILIDRN